MVNLYNMIRLALLLVSISIPVSVFAVTTPENFTGLIYFFLDYIKLIIPLVAALTVVVFLFGLVKFIALVGGNEKEIENGRRLMIYGLVGLLVMVSFWSIITILQIEFGFGDLFIPQLPIK